MSVLKINVAVVAAVVDVAPAVVWPTVACEPLVLPPWAYLFGLAWLGMATVHYIAVFYTRKIFFGEGRRDFIFEQNADLHKYVRHMMK